MLKIMFLEDNQELGRLYSQKLKQANFQILWLKNLKNIEQKTLIFQAEILILDHGLSGQSASGVSLIPKFKKILPQAKIIMLSNYNQAELQEKAFQAGANAFLIKIDTPPRKLVEYIQKIKLTFA